MRKIQPDKTGSKWYRGINHSTAEEVSKRRKKNHPIPHHFF